MLNKSISLGVVILNFLLTGCGGGGSDGANNYRADHTVKNYGVDHTSSIKNDIYKNYARTAVALSGCGIFAGKGFVFTNESDDKQASLVITRREPIVGNFSLKPKEVKLYRCKKLLDDMQEGDLLYKIVAESEEYAKYPERQLKVKFNSNKRPEELSQLRIERAIIAEDASVSYEPSSAQVLSQNELIADIEGERSFTYELTSTVTELGYYVLRFNILENAEDS